LQQTIRPPLGCVDELSDRNAGGGEMNERREREKTGVGSEKTGVRKNRCRFIFSETLRLN
jgi:hypothetical protein